MRDAQIARLRLLIDLYAELGDISKQNSYTNELDRMLNTDTSGWIQKASEIKDVFAQLYFRPDYEGPFEHFDRWKQDYDDAVEKLSKVGTGNLSDSAVKALENQRDMLNKLSVLLGFGEGFENYGTIKERQKAADKEAKERLDMIRDWIKRIQDLKDLYAEFKELGVQDANMVSLFGSMLGELGRHGMDKTALDYLKNYDFDNAVKVYTDMLRQGTPEMSAYADEVDEDALEESMRKRLKELQEAEKISERLRGVYEELAGIMAVSGSGVEHDFSKIVSDLARQSNELRSERDVMEAEAKEKFDIDGDVAEYESALDAIDNLYNAKLDKLRAESGEKIRDLASKYVDELIKGSRLDLSDYADKTIGQIGSQIDTLWDIYGRILNELSAAQGDADIAQSFGLEVDGATLNKINMLKDALTQMGVIMDNVADEKMKKVYDYLLSGVDYLLSGLEQAVDFMQELADVSGDVDLGSAADQLGAVAQNLGAAAQGASQGGWIGAIVGGVTDIINQIVQSVFSAKLSVEQAERSIREFMNSIWLNSMRMDEDDYDTIFGTNSFQKAMDAYDMAKKNLEEYNRLVNQPMEQPETQTAFRSLGASIFTGGLFSAGFGKVETNLSKTLKDAYERGLNALQGIMVKTKDRSGFAEFFGAQDEYKALADYAPELFNDDGSLNVENAKLFLEEEHNIEDSQLRQLENAIELTEQYEEAMEIVKEFNAELMSEVSDDISNAIFDAVLNGADAWDAFNDSAVKVIDNIGRQMIQEFIVQSYLGQFEDDLRDAFESDNPSKAISDVLFELYGGLGDVLGTGMEAYQDWLDYMTANGLDISSLYGQGESLAEGIDRITEEQADLLASYVNAIRAYVAQIVERAVEQSDYLRTINENINVGLAILKEINSNTAVIKENTDQMGRLMKSLTTSGSSVAINARMM